MVAHGLRTCSRLANRVREQLWRYYPQALELGDDLAADWFLDLWALAPTPAKAARLRESRVAGLLKAHRIRRIDATEVLRILRQKPLVVAGGTVEAATAGFAGGYLPFLRFRHGLRQFRGFSDRSA